MLIRLLSPLKGSGVAQMMIATATPKFEKLRREVDKVRESQKQLEKEKRKLLLKSCRKQGQFKQLDVVCFDHKSCVLAYKNLNINSMYFVLPQRLLGSLFSIFALPKTFLTAFLYYIL